MKPRSQANRGRWLEASITLSAELAARRGTAQLVKLATPYALPRDGADQRRLVRLRSTVDFVGVAHGIPVAFDAKATAGRSLPFSHVQTHQLDWLFDFRRAGGVAGLVVGFEHRGVWLVDVLWWLEQESEAARGGRKSVCVETIRDVEAQGHSAPILRGAHGLPLDWPSAVVSLHTKEHNWHETEAVASFRD